jgi:hypothetical protein
MFILGMLIMVKFTNLSKFLLLSLILSISASSIAYAQSKDSVRCSKIAMDYVKKQLKSENKKHKKMFVKSCYDVSNVTTLVGVRTLVIDEVEEMYYNFIVTMNREKPSKPFVANIFSISDKKRKEMFPNSDIEK